MNWANGFIEQLGCKLECSTLNVVRNDFAFLCEKSEMELIWPFNMDLVSTTFHLMLNNEVLKWHSVIIIHYFRFLPPVKTLFYDFYLWCKSPKKTERALAKQRIKWEKCICRNIWKWLNAISYLWTRIRTSIRGKIDLKSADLPLVNRYVNVFDKIWEKLKFYYFCSIPIQLSWVNKYKHW